MPTKDFGLDAFGPGFEFVTRRAQKGNQVVLVELATVGGTSLRADATFYPLDPAMKETTYQFDLR
jgi:hypothetical protein